MASLSALPPLSEDLYRQILDAIDALILVKAEGSRVLWANKAYRELSGMSSEELYGFLGTPFKAPEYAQRYRRDDAHVFTTGERLEIPEEPVALHDGSVRFVRTIKAPLRAPDGEIVATVGVFHDITVARQAALYQKVLAQAFGAASDGMLVARVTDEGSAIIYANTAMERMLGRGRPELEGASLDVYFASAGAGAADELRKAARERIERSVEFTVTKGEHERWMRASLTPVRDASSEVLAFIAVQSDITGERERQRQQIALEEQQRLIQRQQETIHALATPILEIWEGVLTMPLIGVVDSRRAAQMTSALLEAIRASGARFAIVDLTGVEVMDSATADHLLRLVRAARLLGSACVLSGISPSVSVSLVDLGVELGGLRTFGSLRQALGYALGELGMRVS